MTTRRQFLSVSVAPFIASCSRTAPARKMNVLFIAVDDLRPQLGCYGQQQIHSPNIDALAARGLRFDRAYCQQAVCAPSRISLLTGARPDTTKVYDLQTPISSVWPDVVSLPHHFKNNGYETVTLSKIYHHKGDDPQAWSAPDWRPQSDWGGGWRAYRDPASIETVRRHDAEVTAAYEKALQQGKKPRKPKLGAGPPFEGPDVADNAYPDGMTADKAIAELQRLKDRPFFLATGFLKPHLPFNAPKKYWDLYDPADIRLPAVRSWPENAPQVALTNWGELRSYAGMPRQGPVDDDTARKLIHGYYACVSYTDAQIGRVLAELDRLGLRDNTIVILWGDHGWKLNDYGAWCKHTNFEIDTHVPMILSAPGQKTAGQSTRALVEYVDIYPTLAELCGLDIPAHCEGTSMAPLVADPNREWKKAAFSQYPRAGNMMGYSLHTGDWRYTEWIHRPTGEIRARELYDHSRGPIATENLAGKPKYAETVKRLSALLDKGQGWRKVRAELG